jgi:hypothetical protein
LSLKKHEKCPVLPDFAHMQYSGRKLPGFFPVDSCQFPVLSYRNWAEMIGKSPKNFRPEYCFHVPAISGVFLPEPVRTS